MAEDTVRGLSFAGRVRRLQLRRAATARVGRSSEAVDSPQSKDMGSLRRLKSQLSAADLTIRAVREDAAREKKAKEVAESKLRSATETRKMAGGHERDASAKELDRVKGISAEERRKARSLQAALTRAQEDRGKEAKRARDLEI